MKKTLFAALLLMASAAVWFGCGKDEESAESTGSIYGVVTDFATGEPVSNVNVKLKPNGETTLTGSNGTYEFKDIKAGKYSLQFSKAEYADLDDDYVIELEAGKTAKRDVQIRKQMASLQITDMAGSEIPSFDFGLEESVTSKSFNIFNNGTVSINCVLSYNCVWIDTVIVAGTSIAPGQAVAVTVIIDRAKLSSGENRTYLHIVSNNGNNELLITATGYGAPTVTTDDAVSSITANSAKCGGYVISDGGSAVTDRGLCWGTSNAPSLKRGDSHLSIGNGTGTFSGTLTGLSLNTVYYVRAYATNARGTAYGAEKQFTTKDGKPTVTIAAVSNITATSAVCGGSISSNGGFAVTDKGLVWSTSQYPTINDNHLSFGSGEAPFTGSMTNLLRNTTYYVRAYATNANGTSYSEQKKFTTNDGLPKITTNAVTGITASTAVCGGSISTDGGYTISDKGLVWSTSQKPTLSDHKLSKGSGDASFEGTLTNLSRSTTYYVRAYATNSTGTVYGEQKSFTTTNGLPTVTTIAPTKNGTTVTSGGNVTSDGGFPITAKGICYSTTPNPDITSSHSHTSNGGGTGTYSSTFVMQGVGTYYIRAYATNSVGTSYGEQVTINHPYNDLPTFTYGGETYRVAPATSTSMIWSDANSYCNNLTLYGYSDWRLPNEAEMEYYVSRYDHRNLVWWCSNVVYYNTGEYFGHSCVKYEDGRVYYSPGYDSEYYYVRPIRVEH